MTEKISLDNIVTLQQESATKQAQAQKELAALREKIKKGKASTNDPITDFCIVNYGMPTDEQKAAVKAIADVKGEYLVHTIVEGRVDDRETFHSPLKWAKAHIEYLRYGTTRGAKITPDGIILPGKYAWCRREGKEFSDIGLGTMQFSDWAIDRDVLITPLEIASTGRVWDMQLLKLHDLPEDLWNVHFKHEFEPLRATSLVYTGKGIAPQFKRISEYLQENDLYKKAKDALAK